MHSSTSIDMRLRNIMVVGFISTSPSEIVGNSSGKPPADHTPRFTASATWRRCALQLVSSDHELAMPITGRPSKTTSLKPSAFSQERCTNPSRSCRPNQLRLRSEWGVMAPSERGAYTKAGDGRRGCGACGYTRVARGRLWRSSESG